MIAPLLEQLKKYLLSFQDQERFIGYFSAIISVKELIQDNRNAVLG